jgi:hypothetical protein
MSHRIVFKIKSKLFWCFFMPSSSLEIKTSWTPKRLASFLFLRCCNHNNMCPNALANLTPIWPNPPKPTTPTLSPFTFQ